MAIFILFLNKQMNQQTNKNLSRLQDSSLLIVIFLGLIYLLLPSSNSTQDSFSYAICVRDSSYLFWPHHLLYNLLPYLFTSLFNIKDTLAFMNAMNAVFATACLLMTRAILLPFVSRRALTFVLLLVGSGYGFLRFATDSEAYIVPFFFALAGSYLLLKKQLITAGLSLAIACLFHQLFFFWWLCLLCFSVQAFPGKRVSSFFRYGLPAFLVPLVYFLVYAFTSHDSESYLVYIFHDYVKYEDVNVTFKSATLILTPINFIRTFIQVHGYFAPLIQSRPWLLIPIGASIVLFVLFFIRLCKKGIQQKKTEEDAFHRLFAQTHLWIFITQLLFAIISDANAEFMYMLPFVLMIYLTIRYEVASRMLAYLSVGIFIWNISLGTGPLHFLQISPCKTLVDYIQEHPEDTYYLSNRGETLNQLTYYYPQCKATIHSPYEKEMNDVDSLLNVYPSMVTDLLHNKTPLSRGTIVYADRGTDLSGCTQEKLTTLTYDLGEIHLYKVSKRKE